MKENNLEGNNLTFGLWVFIILADLSGLIILAKNSTVMKSVFGLLFMLPKKSSWRPWTLCKSRISWLLIQVRIKDSLLNLEWKNISSVLGLKILYNYVYRVVKDWIVFTSNLYFEAPTPNVSVFGDKAYKGLIKIKWDSKGGALIL